MEPAPIQSGAIRPQGRKRHALYLVRLIAVAGFALAGWVALAALTDAASASEPAPQKTATDTLTPGRAITAPLTTRPADVRPADTRPVFDDASGDVDGIGDRPMREVEAWGRGLPERVREVRDRPVRFLQERRHKVFDRKDKAVRHVREMADAAGIPRVRIADVPTDVPIVDGLVREIADAQPVPPGEGPPAEAQEQPAADGEIDAGGEAPGGAEAAPNAQPSPASGADAGDEETGHCAGCQGDQRAPGPVTPSGQDNQRSAGGPSFAPIADLRHGLYAAAPPAVTASTFHRTALTDVSAPGGPSVVPD